MLGKAKLKTNETATKMNTVIGTSTTLEGVLIAAEVTRIDGTVKGEVKSQGKVIIGTEGKIVGNIYAAELIHAGLIQGDITVTGKTEIKSTGKLYGDICTKSMVIDEFAIFQGKCTMGEQQPAPEFSADHAMEDKLEINAAGEI